MEYLENNIDPIKKCAGDFRSGCVKTVQSDISKDEDKKHNKTDERDLMVSKPPENMTEQLIPQVIFAFRIYRLPSRMVSEKDTISLY
jgi:hypothetical protein